MSESKQELREEVWSRLDESGETLFPGPYGRIPNFKGRDKAADRLVEHRKYCEADTIKINPDSPQKPVRKRALLDGKTLFMAVPKLKKKKCFLRLNLDEIDAPAQKLSTIKGASEFGTPIHPADMPEIDLIVTGAVAVDQNGRRLGKGGGYSDLEFGILRHYERIDADVSILTTVHPIQELEPGRIPKQPQDITLSGMYTPNNSNRVDSSSTHFPSIEPDRLDEDQLHSIPVLRDVID